MTRAALVGAALALAACSSPGAVPPSPPPSPAESAPEPAPTPPAPTPSAPTTTDAPAVDCAAWVPDAPYATPLRGPLVGPDPRLATTLIDKGFEPDRAGIERALASGDLTVQWAAITAVSALRCHGLLAAVEAHLTSAAPVAVEAAATLVELGRGDQKQRGKAALHAALSDDSWPEVQLTAATYLARAQDSAGVAVLRRALESQQDALRLQAVLAAPAFDGLDGIDPVAVYESVLLEAKDPSPLVRREAVYRLAALPPSARQQALLEQVAGHDPDPKVRRAAALRLGTPDDDAGR
ncbi:HEAT repeat domain-containing protein [Haliangium sp.]|uniref:HEAT repeat domain-containing protein n=1 Tax=Haliangium sp. TaxID=2663208 RepID=UPI003D09D038